MRGERGEIGEREREEREEREERGAREKKKERERVVLAATYVGKQVFFVGGQPSVPRRDPADQGKHCGRGRLAKRRRREVWRRGVESGGGGDPEL